MLYTVYIVVTGRQSIVAATVYTGKPSLTSVTAEQSMPVLLYSITSC